MFQPCFAICLNQHYKKSTKPTTILYWDFSSFNKLLENYGLLNLQHRLVFRIATFVQNGIQTFNTLPKHQCEYTLVFDKILKYKKYILNIPE